MAENVQVPVYPGFVEVPASSDPGPGPTPPSRPFTPVWLSPADVKEWLRINKQDADDDGLINDCCAATEKYVERCRSEFWTTATPPVYNPDAEAYHGAVMYAARLYRRRNSPGGIEVFGETVSFVTRFDRDIENALQTGAFAPNVVA
jgi:hypothetical protein